MEVESLNNLHPLHVPIQQRGLQKPTIIDGKVAVQSTNVSQSRLSIRFRERCTGGTEDET